MNTTLEVLAPYDWMKAMRCEMALYIGSLASAGMDYTKEVDALVELDSILNESVKALFI